MSSQVEASLGDIIEHVQLFLKKPVKVVLDEGPAAAGSGVAAVRAAGGTSSTAAPDVPTAAGSGAAAVRSTAAGGGLLEKVKQIQEALGVSGSTPKDVLAAANAQMDLPTEGGLPKQADALMEALGLG